MNQVESERVDPRQLRALNLDESDCKSFGGIQVKKERVLRRVCQEVLSIDKIVHFLRDASPQVAAINTYS